MPKIRLGIIGAGNRGIQSFAQGFAQHHSDVVEIVAVADPNTERAQAGLKSINVEAEIHVSPEEMLERKDIEAVVIASVDSLHADHCVMALAHGKHILVDKPLATTAADCLRVIEAFRKADKLFYMGFNLRHDPVLKCLKELLDAGTLGRIFSIHAIEHYNGGRTYMARWNRLREFSGGLWVHKGSHDFDIMNWLLGGSRPVRVSCFANVAVLNEENLPFPVREGVPPGPTCSSCSYNKECPDVYGRDLAPDDFKMVWEKLRDGMYGERASAIDGYHVDLCIYLSDKDTHDHGFAIVEYDNGATGMHSECFVVPFSNRRYILDGTLGYGEADLHGNRVEIRPRWTQERTVHRVDREAGGHGGADEVMLAAFVECLTTGARPTASAVDGTWSVAVGQAAEIARTEKRVVEIAEVLDVGSNLLKADSEHH